MEKRNILLVEDNPDDIELALLAFKKSKILNEVVITRDGAEALEYLFGDGSDAQPGASALPVVILLDLKLPRVSGLEVLKQIRSNERTRFLPVVILTSSREEQDILNGYSLGANSYIVKPVEFEKFTDAIHQFHLYWLLLNESPPFIEVL